MNFKVIDVALDERSYKVEVRPGAIHQISESKVFANNAERKIFLITDQHVEQHYLATVQKQLESLASSVHVFSIPVGEPSKSIAHATELWTWMVSEGADRKSVVVALGGGVVGDLAGFVAATFARGVDFIQIPTSLLAQVDSSVGGKVGINLPAAKNIVGAFWQPQSVLIDPSVLETLGARDYIAGLAEVIKYGVIMDAEFFDLLEANVEQLKNRSVDFLTDVVARCCELKAEVVIEDERESGRRAILNYGHTFGHAIESTFGYGKYLHGEAIAIGMHCAAKLACRLKMVDDDMVQRQQVLFEALGLPTELPADTDDATNKQLVKTMHLDKKARSGVLFLVLPTKIGDVKLIESAGDDLLAEAFRS